ncbi:MAG: PIN domain-containing protein [Promethearchaeia archaeon]
MKIEEIEIPNKIVLDTGIYIEYFKKSESDIKKFLRENLFTEQSNTKLYSTFIIKSEIYYILCRILGKKEANQLLKKIENFLLFEDNPNLYDLAGQIKCYHSISLADCYSIATGIIRNCPILFLEEQELSEEIVNQINKNFHSKVILLERE